MASPAVVGTPTETAISTASTSHVVNLPAGTAGNMFVAVMSKGSAGTTPTVNALTGWNELLDEAIVLGLYIAVKECDGTEGATTTFTLSSATRGAWIVYEVSGQAAFATQAPQVGTTATGSSTTPNPPSVSVTGGSKDILTIACFGRAGEEADDDTWVSAAPAGFGSLRQKACGTAGSNLAGMVATAHLASTTATSDPGTFTIATGAWRAQTIVIHPVPTPTSTAVARLSLASGNTPDVRTGHKIKIRARVTSGAGKMRVALYEGATNRSGDLESSALTTSLANYELAIAEIDAEDITDYSDLEIRIWGYAAGGGAIVFEVAEVSLEIPEGVSTTPISATDSGAGTDASSETVALPRTEAGVGADVVSALARALVDTGTGTDNVGLAAQYALVEAGTGNDVSSVFRNYPVTDTGVGTETLTLMSVYAPTDTGAGTDNSSLVASASATDTGTGADVSSVGISFSVVEAGLGDDVSSSFFNYPLTDTGSGAETSSIDQAHTVTDTGAGDDTSTLAQAYAVVESGVGADTSVVSQSYAVTEEGTGADDVQLVALALAEDSATGTDVAALVSEDVLTGTDEGTGADVSVLTAQYSLTDTAAGTDIAVVTVAGAQVTDDDVGTGDDAAALHVAQSLVDAGALTQEDVVHVATYTLVDSPVSTQDVAALVAVAAVIDAGVGVDAAFVGAVEARAGVDAGVGSDTAIVSVSMPLSDTGTGDDVVVPGTVFIEVIEVGAGTDLVLLIASVAGSDGVVLVTDISVVSVGTPWVPVTAVIYEIEGTTGTTAAPLSSGTLSAERLTSTIRKVE